MRQGSSALTKPTLQPASVDGRTSSGKKLHDKPISLWAMREGRN